MATVAIVKLWRDPRTQILKLRRRIPARLKAVSGLKGDTVKISTGTRDEKVAASLVRKVQDEWDAKVAEWERKFNEVALTPEQAGRMAAGWAAWIEAGHPLNMGGETSDVFEPMSLPEARTSELVARMWDRVEAHAIEAEAVSGVAVASSSRPLLLQALLPVVAAAYLQRDLRRIGVEGSSPALNPLQVIRSSLPRVADAAPPTSAGITFNHIFEEWAGVAVSKPRTVAETRYVFDQFKTFVGHDDATRVTQDDMRRWRDASKAGGLTNNTFNNRFSMIRQVFAHAVSNGTFNENPANNSLRLRKSKGRDRHPYTDAEAARILLAARLETTPARRWAHWIMAFTGMRVGEVLQLTKGDVRCEGGVWFLAVHEDDEGKSVKTGNRRNVPLHQSIVDEGFLKHIEGLPEGGPVFPDKKLDRHGNRGGRGWNVVGKWVRTTVGITDPGKAPNHSWRHRLEDELRAAEVPEDARDAIVGHARKTTGRSYGVRGEALTRLARELAKVRPPPGLD